MGPGCPNNSFRSKWRINRGALTSCIQFRVYGSRTVGPRLLSQICDPTDGSRAGSGNLKAPVVLHLGRVRPGLAFLLALKYIKLCFGGCCCQNLPGKCVVVEHLAHGVWVTEIRIGFSGNEGGKDLCGEPAVPSSGPISLAPDFLGSRL